MPSGLDAWMEQVAALHAEAARALEVDVVHDLRVALRRCRSLAQGLREVDTRDGARRFKALAAHARPLFDGLGALRDAQVMLGHARALLVDDPALPAVARDIGAHIEACVIHARDAVTAFSVPAWRAVGAGLGARASALLRERALLDHLLLMRFHEAYALHARAMRTRRAEDLHDVRIGVKKLRYAVEAFAPDMHAAAGKLLKRLQEVLGDLHDLDVLLEALRTTATGIGDEDRARACGHVGVARATLLDTYLALARPAGGLRGAGAWQTLRDALPGGARRTRAVTAGVQRRALVDDDDTGHGRHELRSLERAAAVLLHGLRHRLPALGRQRACTLVARAAACAVAHGGNKASVRRARALPLAVGFDARERALVAVLAGSTRRAPHVGRARVQALAQQDRATAVQLGAILHVADAVKGAAPMALRLEGGVCVLVLGLPLDALPDGARRFAEARGPLESLLGGPVWWRALEVPARAG